MLVLDKEPVSYRSVRTGVWQDRNRTGRPLGESYVDDDWKPSMTTDSSARLVRQMNKELPVELQPEEQRTDRQLWFPAPPRSLSSRWLRAAGAAAFLLFVAAFASGQPNAVPAARPSDAWSIYVSGGPVSAPGILVQCDTTGKTLGMIKLQAAAYGIATIRGRLVLACPERLPNGGVLTVAEDGSVTRPLLARRFSAPIAAAVDPRSQDVILADNDLLSLSRLHSAPFGRVVTLVRATLTAGVKHFPDMHVAATRDGYIIFSSSDPKGVFRFKNEPGSTLPKPLIEECGGVAADPMSNQWATLQADSILVFEGDKLLFSIPFPRATAPDRYGLLSYTADGRLVTVVRTAQGAEIHLVNIKKRDFTPLFAWTGDQIKSIAVGPPMSWSSLRPPVTGEKIFTAAVVPKILGTNPTAAPLPVRPVDVILFAPALSDASYGKLEKGLMNGKYVRAIRRIKSLVKLENRNDEVLLVVLSAESFPLIGEIDGKSLREIPTVGIGHGAAQLFGKIGLELNDGRCAHGTVGTPKATVLENSVIDEKDFQTSFFVFEPKVLDDTTAHNSLLSGVYIGPKATQMAIPFEVIALQTTDPKYALVARHRHHVLVGIDASPDNWSMDLQKLVLALVSGIGRNRSQ